WAAAKACARTMCGQKRPSVTERLRGMTDGMRAPRNPLSASRPELNTSQPEWITIDPIQEAWRCDFAIPIAIAVKLARPANQSFSGQARQDEDLDPRRGGSAGTQV